MSKKQDTIYIKSMIKFMQESLNLMSEVLDDPEETFSRVLLIAKDLNKKSNYIKITAENFLNEK